MKRTVMAYAVGTAAAYVAAIVVFVGALVAFIATVADLIQHEPVSWWLVGITVVGLAVAYGLSKAGDWLYERYDVRQAALRRVEGEG